MQTVAFLRGMNVGGHRITNDALRAAFEALGFERVGTYRASGNVFFSGPPTEEAAQTIAAGLEAALGYAVPTVLRSGDAVRSSAAAQPFSPAELDASRGKVQVTLLATAPSPEVAAEVLALATDADRLALVQQALFWLPSGGILDSDLDTKRLDRLLGLGTTRTLGTLQGIANKLG
ncbi:MAG: hypothetical protein ACI8PZ_005574 [Myxococcota bacterium]|jgi:uncharacterized protein (DUF1697 family)